MIRSQDGRKNGLFRTYLAILGRFLFTLGQFGRNRDILGLNRTIFELVREVGRSSKSTLGEFKGNFVDVWAK